MTLQEALFIAALAFFVLGALFVAAAVFIFVARNVPDVRADLSGRKRAQAVSRMDAARPGRDRRKGAARNEPVSGTAPVRQAEAAVPDASAAVSAAAYRPQPDGASSAQVESRQVPPARQQEAAQRTVAEQAGGQASDASVTVILPDDMQSTVILSQEGQPPKLSADAPAPTASPASTEAPSPGSFEMVRRIVMMESIRVVKVD